MLLLFSLFCFYRPNKIKQYDCGYVEESFKVKEAKANYIIVKRNDILFYVSAKENEYLKNDELFIKGDASLIEKDLDLYIFDFTDYLKNKRVFYQIKAYEVTIEKRNASIQDKAINLLTSKLENESLIMVKMLLFNDKNADIDVYNNLVNINALHLFVVSGFHISFLFNFIKKILSFLKGKENYIALAICIAYVFLLEFTISSTRALVCLICSCLFKDKINNFDACAISGIIFLFIEPLNVYSFSFIMTYIIAYSLGISRSFISKENKFIQLVLTSFVCIFALLPIQLIINYQINFISFFTNMILNYLVSVIFVLSLISVLLSTINGNILSFIYRAFFNLIAQIDNKTYSLIFGSMKSWMIIVYYLIFILILYAIEKRSLRKFITSFSILLLGMTLLYFRGYFINYQQITFLNVYQGDCTIIVDKHNKGVMLIDTGGIANYDIASKKIVPYLHYHGIKSIDSVVITHDDYDHSGALKELKKLIPIKNIITQSDIDTITCGDMIFKNLNCENHFDNDNDSSIVLYGNICDKDILFMGDASIIVEKEIIKKYGYFNVDILKVGHHGSNTSSSEEFISFYHPLYAIISVGANNHYGHPNQSVIDILNEYECFIYRTDIDGTIKINYKIFDSYFFETAK